MANRCVNINDAYIQKLFGELDYIDDIKVVGAIVGLWQERVNELENYPTLEQFEEEYTRYIKTPDRPSINKLVNDFGVFGVEYDSTKDHVEDDIAGTTLEEIPGYNNLDLLMRLPNLEAYYNEVLGKIRKKSSDIQRQIENNSFNTIYDSNGNLIKNVFDARKEKKYLSKKQKEVEERLSVMTNSNFSESFKNYISDIQKEIEVLLSSNVDDLQEAKQRIEFINEILSFTNDKSDRPWKIGKNVTTNPLFIIDDVINPDGTSIFTESEKKIISELRDKNEELTRIYNERQKDLMEVSVNDLANFKGADINALLKEYEKNGLQDIDVISSWLLDITASGIVSGQNGIIPQTIMKIFESSINYRTQRSVLKNDRLKELSAIAEKKLIQLGIHTSPFGKKLPDWTFFQEKTESGLLTSKLIHKFNNNYWKFRDFFSNEGAKLARQGKWAEYHKRRKSLWYKNHKFLYPGSQKVIDMLDEDLKKEYLEILESLNIEIDPSKDNSAEIESLVGKNFIENVYRDQAERIQRFIEDYNSLKETIYDQYSVEVDKYEFLSDSEKKHLDDSLKQFNVRENPFVAYDTLDNFLYFEEIGEERAYPNWAGYQSSLVAIPRKYKTNLIENSRGVVESLVETNEETGFYNKDFEIIEQNEELYNFWSLIKSQLADNKRNLADDLQYAFSEYFILGQDKNAWDVLYEVAQDKDWLRAFGAFIKKFLKDFVSKIADNKKEVHNAELFKDRILEKDRINDNFIRNNLASIKNYEKLILKALKSAKNDTEILNTINIFVNIPLSDRFLNNYKINGKLTADNLKQLSNDLANHVVSSQKSKNLVKSMLMYNQAAELYAARKETLPVLEQLKDYYVNIKAAKTKNNPQGGDDRKNAIKQIESWYQRVVLNQPHIESFGKMADNLSGKFSNKFATKNFNLKIKNSFETEIQKNINKLRETTTNERMLTHLNELEGDLGNAASLSAVFYNILNFIRFKGLGWKPASWMTNFLEGQISNKIHAERFRDILNPEDLDKYNPLLLMREESISLFNKKYKGKAALLKAIINEFDILQDATNEIQRSNLRSTIKNNKIDSGKILAKLDPYYGIHKGEFYNQAPIIGAILHRIKVTDVNGENPISLMEALTTDDNGKLALKEGYNTEKNIANWIDRTGKDFKDATGSIMSAIINFHGDFTNTRGMRMKSNALGSAMMMFKTWLPRTMLYNFFGESQYNYETQRVEKGIARSFTPATAGVSAGLLSLVTIHPFLAIPLGVAAAYSVGTINNRSTGMNAMQIIPIQMGSIMLKMIGFPINIFSQLIRGKSVISGDLGFDVRDKKFKKIDDQFFDSPNFTKEDIQNFNALNIKLAYMLTFFLLMLLVKSMLWDDDDEKNDPRRMKHNLLVNHLSKLLDQSTSYLNPVAIYDTVTRTGFTTFMKDLFKLAQMAPYFTERNVRTGKNKFGEQFGKTFLPAVLKDNIGILYGDRFTLARASGMDSYLETQWNSHWFDRSFHSDYKIKKKQIQANRKRVREQMKEDANYHKLDDKAKKKLDKKIRKHLDNTMPYPEKEPTRKTY